MHHPNSSENRLPTSHRWFFSLEHLSQSPSIKDGMTTDELYFRSSYIVLSFFRSQLCICAAMMHMHRFFVFHSFSKFDARDVGAACLFFAGKTEECPRKLEHVARVLWLIKFPFTNGYIISLVYKTAFAAFDLSVDLPHPYVLKNMANFIRVASAGNRKISEIAFWFASDVLYGMVKLLH
ncbi:unnamed protein product [Dracunculus medinensis]|uniref:Cyclin N-terminal domain-containing protein n=1 Tax=Dracunculus medinensis TaxID=318479 RepID=A0A0N4UA46_DRAME|nr:unnamed protein product [Dracunculus medinensis]